MVLAGSCVVTVRRNGKRWKRAVRIRRREAIRRLPASPSRPTISRAARRSPAATHKQRKQNGTRIQDHLVPHIQTHNLTQNKTKKCKERARVSRGELHPLPSFITDANATDITFTRATAVVKLCQHERSHASFSAIGSCRSSQKSPTRHTSCQKPSDSDSIQQKSTPSTTRTTVPSCANTHLCLLAIAKQVASPLRHLAGDCRPCFVFSARSKVGKPVRTL